LIQYIEFGGSEQNMKQNNKSFKIYVRQMDEVSGHQPAASWYDRNIGGAAGKQGKQKENLERLSIALQKYLNFDIDLPSIKSGIEGNYNSLSPENQAFMVVARSIFSSMYGGNPVGVNKGQMQSLAKGMSTELRRHLGSEANSVEALTLFIGQMAQQVGGHITLEPRFQQEVQDYYDHQQKSVRGDRARQNKIKRGGLEFVGQQIKSMGLQDETIKDLHSAVSWALRQAAARGNAESDADVSELRKFLRGIS
jgi:hypothetical protein